MIIQHNMQAMNTNRQLGSVVSSQAKSTEKLSSGYRINRAGDDAAGLAISEKMRGQIRGLNRASKNSQDGISLIQTAEGALNETHSILQRMRELSVQAANDTNVTTDRSEIQKEINELTSEINRIGNTTEFNTMKLLNGERTSEQGSKVGTSLSAGGSLTAQTKGVALTGNIGDYLRTTSATSTAVSERTGICLNGASGAATITITRNGNSLVVTGEVRGTDSLASAKVTINQTVYKDTNGNYSIKANGLEFFVFGDDFDKIEDGSTMTYKTENASATATIRTTAGVKSTYASESAPKVTVTTKSSGANVPKLSNVSFSVTTNSAAASVKGTINVTVELADGTTITSKVEIKSAVGSSNTVTITLAGGSEVTVAFTGISGSGTLSGSMATSDLQKFTAKGTHDVDVAGGSSLTFQVGANEHQSMNLGIDDMRAAALGITGRGTGFTANANVTDGTSDINKENALDVTSSSKAANAITVLDKAINKVSSQRAKLGAIQNRLEHTISNLDTSAENLQSSESRIRDVNMAEEMMNYSKNGILQQAAQSMLAQANQSTQGVLSLLQ